MRAGNMSTGAPLRLTRKRLNAHLWAKHGFALRQRRGVVEVAERNFGLYGTAPTCYLSLLARVPDFRFADLDAATAAERRLVRLRAMRGSQFLVSTADLPATFQATKDLPQSDFRKILAKAGVSADVYRETAACIEDLLAAAPRTATEIRAAVAPDSEPLKRAFSFLIARMCAEGRLVRAGVRGGWRSDRFEYALTRDWLPDVDLEAVGAEEARRWLARRYFAAYGPATAADFRWWSGFSKKNAEATLAALAGELAEVDVLGLRQPHFALREEASALASRAAPVARGAALLPVWDAYLMAYADRDRYLDPEWADRVVDPNGNVTSVILAGGTVAGVWDFEERPRGLKVKVAPFADLTPAVLQWVRQAAVRLVRAAGGGRELVLERCRPSRPLAEGTRNQFLSPLKDADGLPETIRVS